MENIFSPQEDFGVQNEITETIKQLIPYAIAAPSSHNSQPWKFELLDEAVMVYADFDRWLQVADADKRELFMSVGCAIENVLVAARYHGLNCYLHFYPYKTEDRVAKISFTRGYQRNKRDELFFENIPARHTNHKAFAERPIAKTVMEEMLSLNDFEELRLVVWDDTNRKQIISQQIYDADVIQFSNPAFRRELAYWIGEGVFGHQWLIAKLAKLAVGSVNMGEGQAKKDREIFKQAPAIALIYALEDSKETQVKAGMLYQRIALFLNNYNVRTQSFSNLLELPETRNNVAKLLPDAAALPMHFFRVGYADPEKKRTPRRPVSEVIVPEDK